MDTPNPPIEHEWITPGAGPEPAESQVDELRAGAPVSASPRGGSSRRVAVITAAAIALAATGGVAYATTRSSGSTGVSGATSATNATGAGGAGGQPGALGQPPAQGQSSQQGQSSPQGQAPQGAPGAGGLGGIAAALHGELVVASGSSGSTSYVTELVQSGKVTAVSSSSITIASDDGYTHTYAITTSTSVNQGAAKVSAIAVGNVVNLVATVSGSSATVTTILDQTLAGSQLPQGSTGGAPGAAPGLTGTT